MEHLIKSSSAEKILIYIHTCQRRLQRTIHTPYQRIDQRREAGLLDSGLPFNSVMTQIDSSTAWKKPLYVKSLLEAREIFAFLSMVSCKEKLSQLPVHRSSFYWLTKMRYRFIEVHIYFQFRMLRDLLASEASASAFALLFIITHSFSARRWCCLAFFARFGASRLSLSRNASLNFSATGNSSVLETDDADVLGTNPDTAQVLGSISSTKGSSNDTSSLAPLGTSTPL